MYKSEQERSLSSDTFYGHSPFAEVWLSPTQFAELLTTMNVGSGVPGTLRSKDGKRFNTPTPTDKELLFKKEMNQVAERVTEGMEQELNKLNEKLSSGKPLGKKAQEELREKINSLIVHFKSNSGFVAEQFEKQMNRTVTEAKGEVEAFITHAIVSTGLEGLKQKVNNGLLIEDD